MCIFYSAQNVLNLEACFGAFAYVMGAVDHHLYPNQIVPIIKNPAIIWVAIIVVIGLELAAGMFAARGAWDLWHARSSSADQFNDAKSLALIGCGLGILVWLGLFAVFGGALLVMWQTDFGRGSLGYAFQMFGAGAVVYVIVNTNDR